MRLVKRMAIIACMLGLAACSTDFNKKGITELVNCEGLLEQDNGQFKAIRLYARQQVGDQVFYKIYGLNPEKEKAWASEQLFFEIECYD